MLTVAECEERAARAARRALLGVAWSVLCVAWAALAVALYWHGAATWISLPFAGGLIGLSVGHGHAAYRWRAMASDWREAARRRACMRG